MGKETEAVWDGMEMKILTPLTGDFFQEEASDWEEEVDHGDYEMKKLKESEDN